ncbi:glycosyltransferase family 4 protein [Sphingobacterium sp. SGG-5]|uniref:glycosyltransferase n=1 Tax=Sphingobacterium sp. SGG-5 TaxID=2710881 RepID=UPI0013EA2349|nr:glycosyltransferase [Sphingobacterium sp. SGG-5]NGM63422.1 glycosyltransferase family 4 protein [Sphingobacterium sp. SGG-5]
MKESIRSRTKIVYLVNQFHMHGGVQRMLSHKIDAWVDIYGYDVTVITLNQGENPVVYPPENTFKLMDLGLEGVNRHRVKDLWQFLKRLKKVIKKEAPDLIITTLTGIPSLIVPLLYPKVKKVLEIHSSGELSVTKGWRYKWWFLKHYHKVVLLNEDEKKYYRLNNLIVIPNFVKVDNTDFVNYNNREKVILAAGRIHREKQYDHLIQIWEKIYQKYPDWRIAVYGNGDSNLLEKFQNYIILNSIQRIEFIPATDKLDEMLKLTSIFVLTSETECFPMVLIECKKAMLPAISYDSPNGPRHIIADDGILVEHNNIDQFAEALSRLIEDDELRKRLAQRAYNNSAMFSSKEIMKQWAQLV